MEEAWLGLRSPPRLFQDMRSSTFHPFPAPASPFSCKGKTPPIKTPPNKTPHNKTPPNKTPPNKTPPNLYFQCQICWWIFPWDDPFVTAGEGRLGWVRPLHLWMVTSPCTPQLRGSAGIVVLETIPLLPH